MNARLSRLAAWLSDLRLAIGLLIVIAAASGIGTAIPQKESEELYHRLYDAQPWLGLLNGERVLALALDHVYSSNWFLALLSWLAVSLLLCSWRRQWPALRAALRWVDYSSPRQLSKFSLAETVPVVDAAASLGHLEAALRSRGWQIQRQSDRLAARKGVAGRIGPLLVHAGMVVLMLGAAWGALGGQRLEQFLAPGRSLELVDSRGHQELTLALDAFNVQRDPAGRPEQFRSRLRILQAADPAVPTAASLGSPPLAGVPQAPETPGSPAATGAPATPATPSDRKAPASPGNPRDTANGAAPLLLRQAEISVNHPLRFRGVTFYQADWGLAAITIQLGRSPLLQLPLQSFPELGEQVWGVLLPTQPDGSRPVLLLLRSEQGPVEVYGSGGEQLGRIRVGGDPLEVAGLPVRVVGVLPASGILLKRDPGVPLVYAGFAIALLGGGLSVVATRQLWAIAEPGRLHLAGLCNRNLPGFATELPRLLAEIES